MFGVVGLPRFYALIIKRLHFQIQALLLLFLQKEQSGQNYEIFFLFYEMRKIVKV